MKLVPVGESSIPRFGKGPPLKLSALYGRTVAMNKRLGCVYTPNQLADWVAAELVSRLPRKKSILVIDPACGDGALLRSIQKQRRATRIWLAGIDIDENAIRRAASNVPVGTILKHVDALQPGGKDSNVEAGWKSLLEGLQIAGVISNPPWGAELKQTPDGLRKAGYQLAQGQFDSYDLFIELCLRVVPDHTFLAFIIPDSLFLPEHSPLRTMLLDKTQLHLIARLGEGFFDDVYRGTAVIVCEKTRPHLSRSIECFRLRKEQRDRIFANKLSLHAAKVAEAHLVPQKHFQADPEKRFTIDVSREDLSYFRQIHLHRSEWASWLTSGRGVELSKTGAVVLCPNCSVARPEPRGHSSLVCEQCGVAFDSENAKRKRIVKKSIAVQQGWKRLIVGEDVNRYSCESSRIIEAMVPGINYKEPSTFEGTKLLIRKTGVGLKAAIDDSGAFTNQVVFHYRLKPNRSPTFFLDYVLGVLCSRVMLAYHLKQTGDSEWRSHPYVTQKTIAELPVPVVFEGHWRWRQAKAIAKAVSQRRLKKSEDIAGDLYIDSLVAGLYGLDKGGCAWVLDVLNQAQPLQAIVTMRAEPNQLRPVRV
jgi:adenine-specific DNA-methyltransferase